MATPTREWTLDLIREIEWRRFELLIEGLFRHQNEWRAEGGAAGADGGVDLLLYAPGEARPTAAVQCKAYRSKQVGVSIVRELYGVMAAEGIPHGMVFTCGAFSDEAEKFAENKSIDLVSGAHLLALIGELSPESQHTLRREITAGDYTTPTCPACRVKLVRRPGPRVDFWGCVNYPRCHTKLPLAAAAPAASGHEPEGVEDGSPCCQGCGADVEAKVVAFCESPTGRQKFGGKILCRDCQASPASKPVVAAKGPVAAGSSVPAQPAKSSGSACVGCGAAVDDKVAFFCRLPKNQEKFGGRLLCRDCQPK